MYGYSENNNYNFWPSFTDAMVGVFIIFLFFSVILIAKSYFDFNRLLYLEQIVKNIEKDINTFKLFFKEEKIEIKNNEIKIVLGEETKIIFPTDSSTISSINSLGHIRLLQIGQTLQRFLSSKEKVFSIMIEGYTDRVGSDNLNYELSYKRAKNIMLYWQEKADLSPDIYDISPVGYGELPSRLKNQIDTRDNIEIAENRRIEIRLVPKFGSLFKSLQSTR